MADIAAHPTTTSGRHGLVATPRSRGALTGALLVALGIWGALIPFVGTYFGYDYTPTGHWAWTSARFFLEVAPGAATAFGGLVLVRSGNRLSASAGGWLAVAAGAWFLVGPLLAPLFRAGYLGQPTGGSTQVAVEQIGFFYGLGGAIVLLAAFALGRFSVVSVRDVRVGAERAQRKRDANSAAAPVPAPTPVDERPLTSESAQPAPAAPRRDDPVA